MAHSIPKPLLASEKQLAALAAKYGVPVTELPALKKKPPDPIATTPPPRPATISPAPLNAAQIAGNARRAEEKAVRKAIQQRLWQTRKILAERFPACFKSFGQPKLPLKVGIFADITAAAPDIGRHDLINTLTDYCGGASYHRAMIEGAARVDLGGNACGVVCKGDVGHAAKLLKRLVQP